MGLFSLLTSFLILLLTASCTPSSPQNIKVELSDGSTRELSRTQTLIANIGPSVSNFDWTINSDANSALIYENIMAGLLTYSFKGGKIKLSPSLAQNWSHSKNFQKWTFELRRDVYWSDGVLYEAKHSIDAWKALLSPKSRSLSSHLLLPIRNAKKFSQGEASFEDVGIKAKGKHKIVIELEEPLAFFPMLLTHHNTFPIRDDLIKKHPQKWHSLKNITVLGPYKPISLKHDESIILERNEKYSLSKLPSIRFLNLLSITNEATASRLLKQGKVDFNRMIPAQEKEFILESNGLRTTYLAFNTTRKALKDRLTRKYIESSINKSHIIRATKGLSTALETWVPPPLFFRDSASKTNSEQLGKVVIPKERIQLLVNSSQRMKTIAEAIQYQLKKAGFNVEITLLPWKQFLSRTKSKEFDIAIMGWSADYPHPYNFLQIIQSNSRDNITGWNNKKYDNIVKKSLEATSPDRFKKLILEAENLISREAPVVPLLTNKVSIQASPRVLNLHPNFLKKYNFSVLSLKD